jgi:hypothetical protein
MRHNCGWLAGGAASLETRIVLAVEAFLRILRTFETVDH